MSEALDPRRVEYLPLADLIPDPRNPKAHDEQTIDDSIGRFGMLDLIVRDERTGRIISGHGRAKVLAAREARGESAPEGVKVDEEGRWLVPVVVGWASRSDTEAAAALIALNRTTELGGWVDEALLELLEEIDAEGGTLDGVGFTSADMDDLQRLHAAMDEMSVDDLAAQWDGESGMAAADDSVKIVLRDAEVAARWESFREEYATDDAALGALLDKM